MSTELKPISRDQAREAIRCVEAAIELAMPALRAAPYAPAKIAVDSLNALAESVAGSLGLDTIGACEGCETIVFEGDDHIYTRDLCVLCGECRPSDEELAALRAIQEACPKADPECEAQAADDHDRCMSQSERDSIPVVRVEA